MPPEIAKAIVAVNKKVKSLAKDEENKFARFRYTSVDAFYEAIGGIPTRGPKAALTVPGAIGGWKIALELSAALGGKLPLTQLLERAATQAREGVAISPSEQRAPPPDAAALYDVANFRAVYFVNG